MSNNEAVAEALCALGNAYRGDWSDMDGRSLRLELEGLAAWLAEDAAPTTYLDLCRELGVCPVRRSWPQYCDERPSDGAVYFCAHLESVPVSAIKEQTE